MYVDVCVCMCVLILNAFEFLSSSFSHHHSLHAQSISSPHIVLPRAKQDQNPLASSQSAIELLEHVLEKKGEEPVYSSIEDTCNSTPPATAKAQQSDLLVKGGIDKWKPSRIVLCVFGWCCGGRTYVCVCFVGL